MRFLVILVCLTFSISVFAQSKTNFSGEWTLDRDKSDFSDQLRIESVKVTVEQSDKTIKITTDTTHVNIPGQRGIPKRPPSTTTYTLDGKEMTSEEDYFGNKIPVKLTASLDSDGTLHLSKVFETQGGNTVKETWSLSDGGKTLTIKRETTRKTENAEFVFAKK